MLRAAHKARPRRPLGTWQPGRLALGLALVAGAGSASAAPPDDAPPPTPNAPPPPAVVATAPSSSFALSVQLLGPDTARADALDALAPPTTVRGLRDEPRPPGELVGVVPDRAAALRWLSLHIFDDEVGFGPELRTRPAPMPGGALYRDAGLVLAALWLTEVDGEGRPTGRPWPSDRRGLVPEGTGWRTGSLVADRAPLFAAPSPTLPPAREAHAHAHRRGDLLILGEIDRCDPSPPSRHCLRWVQVAARDGDRFVGGYLPAYMVTQDLRWVRHGDGLPRAQLIAGAVRGDRATLALLVRGTDGRLRHRTLTAPMIGDRFPEAEIELDETSVVVMIEGQRATLMELDDELDALTPAPDRLGDVPG